MREREREQAMVVKCLLAMFFCERPGCKIHFEIKIMSYIFVKVKEYWQSTFSYSDINDDMHFLMLYIYNLFYFE